MSLEDFPRYPLIFGPSPVHPLPRLSEHLGGAQIWAKREDCNSGLAFGGNKTRKLEYIVPDALAQGADTLVSIGGVQSNHTRQVAAVAAKLGGPKGLAWSPGQLFVADTENHAVRRIDLATGIITTVLGTGARGDGPETTPLECKLSRPHGLLAVAGGLYVTDSEAHRIRLLR